MPGLQTYLDMYTSAGGPRAGGGSGSGNPFGSMLSSVGGAGMPSPQAPMGGGKRPGGGFNALLTPDAPGLLGILGRLSGNPTREEWLFQKAGAASQAGLTGLAQRLQTMSPQKAIVDFVSSPEGMEYFASVPNAMDEIKKQIGVLVPETADPINVAPGGTVFDPNTQQPIFNNPTTNVQDFTGMAQLSNLPLADIQKIAAAQLAAQGTGDMTQTEAATAEMVKRGMISQETALKLNASVWEFQPVTDATGRTVDHVLKDKTTGMTVRPAQGQEKLPVMPGDPAYAPGVNDDGYDPYAPAEPGAYLKQFSDPADIVEGAGIVPAIAETMGGLADTFLPGFRGAGAPSAKMRRALDQIRNDARGLKESGRYIASDLKLLDSVLPSTNSVKETATSAAEALIQYSLWIDQRVAFAQATYADPRATGEARGKALLELKDLEKAKANVPPVPNLLAKIEKLKTQAPAAVEGFREGKENVKKAIGTGEEMLEQGTMTPEAGGMKFDDKESLQKALRDGTVTDGMTIQLRKSNGQYYPITVTKTKKAP
jgi:hypothetical protein